jgi:hypothetical protein
VFRCGSPDHSRVWRGFPIRTPWDHSPVIDSPRLIADSYVLLRLLMPRHPPCALKNLTTKDQKLIFERTMKTTPQTSHTPKRAQPIHGTDPGSYSWKLLLIKDARVHYVVLKQQPHTPHPTHTTVHDRQRQETRNTQNPHPTPPASTPNRGHQQRTMGHGPVASGPNSVPNTTRRYRTGSVPGPPRPLPLKGKERWGSVLTTGPCRQAPIC